MKYPRTAAKGNERVLRSAKCSAVKKKERIRFQNRGNQSQANAKTLDNEEDINKNDFCLHNKFSMIVTT
jgi:hypothetical protein